MRRTDFSYDLPEALIAQAPAAQRDHSRLMVLDRGTGAVSHRHFYDIKEYLRAGDCLVLNDTKVLPARLLGTKKETGARIEALLLKDLGDMVWECAVYPGKRLKPGAELVFGDGQLTGRVEDVTPQGNRLIRFACDGVFLEVLEAVGTLPLPHYIKAPVSDQGRYQTVYAAHEGSAAAPTAGLHFTPALLEEIAGMGVKVVRLTLHVGLGTFRPVKADEIEEHVMHSEWYAVSEEAAETINAVRTDGGRVIAVGTTSCRTLESVTDRQGVTHAGSGSTDIFIYPGYSFKGIDGIVTNFHLPESTLIMLISAFAGRENVLEAYHKAVEAEYRFFSFGDAMLIV